MSQSPDPDPHQWYDSVPRSITRHAIFGIALMVLAFGGFGAWAFRAPLAAAVIAQGSFVATGRNKIIQHLEGGIIEEILVGEGDTVSAGDILLRLDETAALATKRELAIRQARLEATATRLLAEYETRDDLIFSDALLAQAQDPEIGPMLASQRLSFEVAKSALENDLALLNRNMSALAVRADGYARQLASQNGELEVLNEELESKTLLFEQGLNRRTDINAIRRALYETEGQIGRLEAEIAEIGQMRLRLETQIEQAHSAYRSAALDELQVIQAELESIREQARKAESVLERSDLAAPVSGTVVRLYYHTPGGVIETGKPIAEILPSYAPLIIETLVPRTEIDSVREGQHAVVRLTALNQRTTPVLDGEVIYVSADAVEDQTEGVLREVYVARVALSTEELARVEGFVPTPGMPAEIMIQTAERTFAQYLAKPIADSMTRAFREQ